MGVIALYLLISIAPAIAARSRGRDPLVWFVLSLLVSPLVTLILLFLLRDLHKERLLKAATRQVASTEPLAPPRLRYQPMLGGRTSRVTIDRGPRPFEPDGLYAGIPYRITADGAVDCILQGAIVRFADMDRFLASVGGGPA